MTDTDRESRDTIAALSREQIERLKAKADEPGRDFCDDIIDAKTMSGLCDMALQEKDMPDVWQPIHTAPLDGTPVILWAPTIESLSSPNRGAAIIARFMVDDEAFPGGAWVSTRLRTITRFRRWWLWGPISRIHTHDHYLTIDSPTLWMDVPVRPE